MLRVPSTMLALRQRDEVSGVFPQTRCVCRKMHWVSGKVETRDASRPPQDDDIAGAEMVWLKMYAI